MNNYDVWRLILNDVNLEHFEYGQYARFKVAANGIDDGVWLTDGVHSDESSYYAIYVEDNIVKCCYCEQDTLPREVPIDNNDIVSSLLGLAHKVEADNAQYDADDGYKFYVTVELERINCYGENTGNFSEDSVTVFDSIADARVAFERVNPADVWNGMCKSDRERNGVLVSLCRVSVDDDGDCEGTTDFITNKQYYPTVAIN